MTEKSTILIVDDTPDNIFVLNNLLKDEYKTKIANNGEKALRIASSDSPPDLILLDIMMPEMDGYEVCKRLKAEEITRDIPVIFLTAKTQMDDEQKGLELGAVDYITKPISPPILITRVKTHLQLKKTTDLLKNQNIILEEKVEARTRQLATMNQSMTRFVPEEFLKELGCKDVTEVELGDHKFGTMTVQFSDIRSYTTFAESMSANETFSFLNAYLMRIGPVIRECDGFVNQYYGDGIMSIFPKTPEDSLTAAINMQKKVSEYNVYRKQKDRQEIKIGIGINTGPLMIGIIGDGRRMDTGVVSDTVNTAARMEGLTKYYGVSIALSETTYNGMTNSGTYNFRFLDYVRVKGKSKEMGVYEEFSTDPEDLFERKLKTKSILESGQKHYFAREFGAAVKCFTDVLMILPEDLTTKYYLERSSKFLLQGVPADWQGICEIAER